MPHQKTLNMKCMENQNNISLNNKIIASACHDTNVRMLDRKPLINLRELELEPMISHDNDKNILL